MLLENKPSEPDKVLLETQVSKYHSLLNSAKEYLVDTSASVTFYTPIMASMEYLVAGMELPEVLTSRIAAASLHLVTSRPFGKFREWYAGKWNADVNSSSTKKFLVDTSALLLYQILLYSSILACSGASLEEAVVALPTGLMIGASTGRGYGKFLDRWRKKCGTKPTLED
jgi:hypothetical protein